MNIIFIIGLLFSPLAAIAAFLIVYDEASHHYTSKKEPFQQALTIAIFAFLVFIAITIFIELLMGKVISGG